MVILWIVFLCIQRTLSDEVERGNVTIYSYTRSNPVIHNHKFNLSETKKVCSYFQLSKPLTIIIHGWDNVTVFDNDSLTIAILSEQDWNVFQLDYPYVTSYGTAMEVAKKVGEYLAEYINHLRKKCNYTLPIWLIGHSIGAHICGFCGKNVHLPISVIIGLDPAGPGYLGQNESNHLYKTDACYVQVIHTSLIGYSLACGTLDFWPYGGLSQPSCSQDSFVESIVCSHLKALEYFRQTILSKTKVIGERCSSYASYESGLCHEPTAYMGTLSPDRICSDFKLNTTALLQKLGTDLGLDSQSSSEVKSVNEPEPKQSKVTLFPGDKIVEGNGSYFLDITNKTFQES